VIVTISIDTAQSLTEEDRAVLRAVGYLDQPAAAEPVDKPAPAKKAAAKKAAATPPKAEPAGESDEDAELRDTVVARASELLASGERQRVLDALKDAGAPSVSKASVDVLPGILAALTDD
jgi:hypothetical protein